MTIIIPEHHIQHGYHHPHHITILIMGIIITNIRSSSSDLIRYEQQGIGLQWNNINLSPLEGKEYFSTF